MAKQNKIIIMEDDAAMAEIVTHKLQASGYEVRHASDGAVGLKMIAEDVPDLVLLDLMMPEVDGFQVLESIRHDKNKKIVNLPVIVLSNLWSNEDILKVKGYAVQEYLVKAYFTPDDILGKIRGVLAKGNN